MAPLATVIKRSFLQLPAGGAVCTAPVRVCTHLSDLRQLPISSPLRMIQLHKFGELALRVEARRQKQQ
jgi:hypothetical protein